MRTVTWKETFHEIDKISYDVQYILANPNSPVPLREEFVPISEFVRISEIALFLLIINNTNICNSQIWVICCLSPFNYFECMKALIKTINLVDSREYE